MAPVIKWQRWDSASYNWLDRTTGGTVYAIEQEVAAWIATVNGHASNAGKQISIMKGYADGTGNNNGIVIEVGANNNADKCYIGKWSRTTSSAQAAVSKTWTFNTNNGGYGSPGTSTGVGYQDSNMSWTTSGNSFDGLIVYDTTEGQEFISVSQIVGTSTATADGWCIAKMENGEWMMFFNDGTVHAVAGYIDGFGWSGPGRTNIGQVAKDGNTGYFYTKLTFYPDQFSFLGTTSQVVLAGDGFSVANAALLSNTGSSTYASFGDRRVLTDLGNGNNVYVMTLAQTGWAVFIDLR